MDCTVAGKDGLVRVVRLPEHLRARRAFPVARDASHYRFAARRFPGAARFRAMITERRCLERRRIAPMHLILAQWSRTRATAGRANRVALSSPVR